MVQARHSDRSDPVYRPGTSISLTGGRWQLDNIPQDENLNGYA